MTKNETLARDLKRGDILSDDRVVKDKAFGPSTHDPAIKVWFEDGTDQIYGSYTPVQLADPKGALNDDVGRSSSEGTDL